MAYLTQFNNSIPVIKFNIEQSLMTIGQDFEMDISIPEDSIAENHATIEAIKNSDSYRFIVKSRENESLLDFNGETVSQAELSDGDWVTIGGVEFQFTDDGINSIIEIIAPEPVLTISDEKSETVDNHHVESDALKLIRELKQEVQSGLKNEPTRLSTKDFIAQSRNSRRRLAI